jgi:hypothetical protein
LNDIEEPIDDSSSSVSSRMSSLVYERKDEKTEAEKNSHRVNKRLKCLAGFIGIFCIFGLYYLWAQIEYSKTAE